MHTHIDTHCLFTLQVLLYAGPAVSGGCTILFRIYTAYLAHTHADTHCLFTLQVLLYAGPAGLKVAKVAEAAKAMGLVASDWDVNKSSRASQISNAIRHTDSFTHVGDHRYAIATFPGVQHVPLKEKGTLPSLSSLLNSCMTWSWLHAVRHHGHVPLLKF